MVKIVKFKIKYLIMVFLATLGVFSILFWPAESSRVHYWQDKFFSPEEISQAHQRDLDGNKMNCRDCHQPGKKITNNTCRKCHDQEYFERNQPFLTEAHQIFNDKDYCLRCHKEHDGTYMGLKFSGFTAQVHRQLPVKTDNCANCHSLTGKKAHPALINDDCRSCHEDYNWASEFEHKKFLSKALNSEQLLALCQDCHIKGYHYTLEPRAREGCIFCHEYWGRRRKNRTIPFPEKFFKDINIDSGKFGS